MMERGEIPPPPGMENVEEEEEEEEEYGRGEDVRVGRTVDARVSSHVIG
jgi:hypothetical protein